MMKMCRSYIAGHWVAAAPEQCIPLLNPGNLDEAVALAQFATATGAVAAMDAARTAAESWRRTPFAVRAALLEKLLAAIEERRDEFAETITRENGKTLRESHAEITAAVREGRYQLGFLRSVLDGGQANETIRYEPLGVTLLITPFNFPMATVIRKLVPALATGNSVVLKPSERTPVTATLLFEQIHAGQFPPGVANMVIADGPTTAGALIPHRALRAISFTGSTRNGRAIQRAIGDRNIRLQAEMGGKNAVVILQDAEMETAVEAVIGNAFACCGQWCTGTSRVIVEAPLYAPVLDALAERAGKIIVGYGLDPHAQMGPLISREQRAWVQNVVQEAQAGGARLVAGGYAPRRPGLPRGHYFTPTILADVTPEMVVATEEVFGPVLIVMKAACPEEALEMVNRTAFGLSFSIYTQNFPLAEWFLAEVEAGLCHLNLPTAYRDPALPLLGWKESGRGWPESGRFALDFFTQTKSIYR